MPNGFFGKILWIDLSNETSKEETLSDEIYHQYLGGYGLATKLIYENMQKGADALGEDAVFGFFPGLLTGTVAPLSGRCMVAGKSPLTNTWGDSNVGGYIGAEIKKCGYDAILFKGIAKEPKYVSIIDGEIQILDATELWGLDTFETEDKIVEKHGKVRIACIGRAGEKLSLISSIVSDKYRVAGRSGFGAVMGSKKLKVLVLKGTNEIPVANKGELLNIVKDFNTGVSHDKTGYMYLFKTLGLSYLNVLCGSYGDSPIKNWGGNWEKDFPMEMLNKISAEEVNKYKQRDYGCFSCPVQCGAIMKVPEAGLEETHIPEYETFAAFGHMLLNDDLISLYQLNDICNRAGIDTISTGGTVAFAIECYENNLITKDDTGGIELTWGNSDTIIQLVKKIIVQDGIGKILADGPKLAAERIGKGSEIFAIHSLGQALPMHNSKIGGSFGSTYAFDPTPGRHTACSLDHHLGGLMSENLFIKEFILPKQVQQLGDDRYEAMKMTTGLHQCLNSLGLCFFIYWFQTYPLLELIKAVVGWDLSIDDVLKIGLRIQNLRQAFTLREGVTIAANELPARAVGIPNEDGPNEVGVTDYKKEYKGYCEKMGWNPVNGYPLKETLINLDLEFTLKDLY
ncbi:hypothetical protein LCGC14_0320730 [marine sediment metagenome]|uniref:Aldehyde ferredoxin oxidoreductase N-terminal domain-containing protein n=1 Tax=marine sediment metagenome TaxID=412755 RepID=A0A0F9W6P6_9ZZZZ